MWSGRERPCGEDSGINGATASPQVGRLSVRLSDERQQPSAVRSTLPWLMPALAVRLPRDEQRLVTAASLLDLSTAAGLAQLSAACWPAPAPLLEPPQIDCGATRRRVLDFGSHIPLRRQGPGTRTLGSLHSRDRRRRG